MALEVGGLAKIADPGQEAAFDQDVVGMMGKVDLDGGHGGGALCVYGRNRCQGRMMQDIAAGLWDLIGPGVIFLWRNTSANRSVAAFLILGEVGVEEEVERAGGESVLVDEMLEDGEGGHGIEEGVVPAALRGEILDSRGEAEPVADAAEGMVFEPRPGGAAQEEGVDPGAEGVAGKGPKEAFFGAVPVGDDGAPSEEAFEFGPEGEEGGGTGEMLGRDAMDPPGRPGDGALGMQKRAECFAESLAW